MKKTNTKIERYKEGDWYIDIIENEDAGSGSPEKAKYEIWLSNRYYGISTMLFGGNLPKKEMLDMLKIEFEDDKMLYIEKYFDEPPFEI